MNMRSVLKILLSTCLVIGLAQVITVAQDQPKVQYTAEEYDAYQQAVNAEPAKREDAILEFIKQHPESALVQYAVNAYLQLMQEYQNQGQPQKVLAAGEQLLAIKSEQPHALSLSTFAAYQTQNFRKATQYGEKAYANKASAGLAFVLANSYNQLENNDKFLQYGEEAIGQLPPSDTYQILGEMMRIYAERENWAKAAEYAKLAVEGFDSAEKPPQTSQREWNDYTRRQKAVAYSILGRSAAKRENWGAASSNYQQVLNLSASPALDAEAYFHLGMAAWKQNKIDAAMKAFAMGSVKRNAPHAEPCRNYLERLYRSTHNDSLAGLEEFLERTTGQ